MTTMLGRPIVPAGRLRSGQPIFAAPQAARPSAVRLRPARIFAPPETPPILSPQ